MSKEDSNRGNGHGFGKIPQRECSACNSSTHRKVLAHLPAGCAAIASASWRAIKSTMEFVSLRSDQGQNHLPPQIIRSVPLARRGFRAMAVKSDGRFFTGHK